MSDFIYFGLVGIACFIWLVASVLWIDLRYREWKWNRHKNRRRGYLHAIPTASREKAASGKK